MSKSQFLLKTLVKYATLQSTSCPYCECDRTSIVQWKNRIWQLRQCAECSLNFRFPKDDPEENVSFYQNKYRQGNVTDLPREEDIPSHISDCFKSVGRDLTTHLRTIRAMVPSGRVLDYGCSWGYGVYQLSKAGYEATGFEISRPRVEYGRRTLNVDLTSDIDSLPSATLRCDLLGPCPGAYSKPKNHLDDLSEASKARREALLICAKLLWGPSEAARGKVGSDDKREACFSPDGGVLS